MTDSEAPTTDKFVGGDRTPKPKRSVTYGIAASGVVAAVAMITEYFVLNTYDLYRVDQVGQFARATVLAVAALLVTWGFCVSWKQWSVWACIWAVAAVLSVGYFTNKLAVESVERSEVREARLQAEAEQAERLAESEVLAELKAELALECEGMLTLIEEFEKKIADPSYVSWRLAAYPEGGWRGSYSNMRDMTIGEFQRKCL